MPHLICAASKAGPGRRGRADEPLGRAERDLAVRADVDEEPQPLVARHPGREQAGDDVAADVGAERGEDGRPRARDGGASPSSAAGMSGYARVAMMNGATPIGSGSIPSASCVIVALPASATSYTCSRGRRRPARTPRRRAPAASRRRASRRRSSASGSSIVAEMREITSAPNGCCLLSIERTATGVPVPTSSSVATTVVVPRSKAIACSALGRVAGLDVDQQVVDDDAGDPVVGLRAGRAAAAAARSASTRSSRSSIASRRRCEVGALVGERRLVELDVALLQGRMQDHLPTDADGGRLRPGRRAAARRRRGRAAACGAAGEPPAVGELGLARTRARRAARPGRRRRRSAPCTSCTCRGRRRSSRSRSRSTRPRRRPSRRAARAPPCPTARSAARPGAAGAAAVAFAGARAAPRVTRHDAAAACACRCAAIQFMPHSSRPSSRSAARQASTVWAVRASMIALVRPAYDASDEERGVQRVAAGQPERDVRRAERHVEAELVADAADRLERDDDRLRVGADRHRERVDHDVLQRDLVPPCTMSTSRAADLEPLVGRLRDPGLVVRRGR